VAVNRKCSTTFSEKSAWNDVWGAFMLIYIFAIYVLLQICIPENQNCATALSRNSPIDNWRKI